MRNVRTPLMVAAVAVMFAISMNPANGQGKGQGKGKGGFQGGGMFGGSASGLMLLANKGVQEELKLTADQTAKLDKAQTEMRAKMGEAFQGAAGDREKMAEVIKQMTEDGTKVVKEIVTPEQMKRLKQIELQVGGFTVLAHDDVQRDLKMTDTQKASLKDLSAEMVKERTALFADIGRGDQEKRAEAMKKMESMTKKAMDQFTATLTADQKKMWTEMTGPKFDYKPQAFGAPPRRDL